MKNNPPADDDRGGWFDAETCSAPCACRRRGKSRPGAANSIVMGPWVHGRLAGGDATAWTRAVQRQDANSIATTSNFHFFFIT